jgi:hypothetical protein
VRVEINLILLNWNNETEMNKMASSNEKFSMKDIVRILLDLYGVVIALALTTSIGLTVAPHGIALSPFELNAQNLATFGTLFITIVPFYHGASVYMLATYRGNSHSTKKGAALVDFFTLSLEGVVFYAMASSIQNLDSFIIWFTVLLLIDLVWYGFTYFKAEEPMQSAPRWWALINGATVLALIVLSAVSVEGIVEAYAILFAVAVIRTVLDYGLSYEYYFPPTKKS